jgi:hypothetical protein
MARLLSPQSKVISPERRVKSAQQCVVAGEKDGPKLSVFKGKKMRLPSLPALDGRRFRLHRVAVRLRRFRHAPEKSWIMFRFRLNLRLMLAGLAGLV